VVVVRCSYVQEMSSELRDLLAVLVDLLVDIQTDRTALPASSGKHSSDLPPAITVCVVSSLSSSLIIHLSAPISTTTLAFYCAMRMHSADYAV